MTDKGKCCAHAPGDKCYQHDCCMCCMCPVDATWWRYCRRFGVDRETFDRLTPEQKREYMMHVNLINIAEGSKALKYSS